MVNGEFLLCTNGKSPSNYHLGEYMDVEPKIGGKKTKLDGENNGKPLLKWMSWGYHYFWKHPDCLMISKSYQTLINIGSLKR